jgi:hypothetical protein
MHLNFNFIMFACRWNGGQSKSIFEEQRKKTCIPGF